MSLCLGRDERDDLSERRKDGGGGGVLTSLIWTLPGEGRGAGLGEDGEEAWRAKSWEMGAASARVLSQLLIQVPMKETSTTRVDDRFRTIIIVRVEYVGGVCLSM